MDKADFFSEARDDLTGPLAGVRVLEVTSTWAGPMTGVVLADLGADVIKVEIPSGDIARSLMVMPGCDVALMHATVNRNKRSLAIDMTNEDARSVLLDLAATCDVFVENFKTGTLARHGLGYDDVRSAKDDIIYVSVTGWGQFGPEHQGAGYDPLAQATSGFMSVNGSPDMFATKAGTFLADDLGGLHGAIGAMAALRHRDQTGEGQHVDVSLLDAMLFQTNGLPTLGTLGIQPERWGNQFGFLAPCDIFECTDGPIYAGVLLDSHWARLAEIIGQEELAHHESFATIPARVANRDVCNMLLGSWLAERTRDEAVAILRPEGMPVAKVQTFAEVAADPHIAERDMLQPTVQEDGVTVSIVGPPLKFSRTPVKVRHRAPGLGEHNDEVLQEAGLDAAARALLAEKGAFG